MDKVRIGVIGAGSWVVSAHLPRLAERTDVELVAVCRRGPEALAAIAQQWGFEVATEDPAEVLAAGVDAVIVGSPAGLHYEHVKMALEAGCHVLCEKPFTLDPEQAVELVALATKMNRELVLAFGWNFTSMVAKAQAILADPGIGAVEHLTLHMSSATRDLLMDSGAYPEAAGAFAPDKETWTNPELSGGGYAQAQLTHALGLTMLLFDLEAVAASTVIFPARRADVDLHLVATMEFASGAVGAISGGSGYDNAAGGRHQLELRVIGSEGQFLIDLAADQLWLHRPDTGDVRPEVLPGEGGYQFVGPITTLIDAAAGRPFSKNATGELGVRVTDAISLLYSSMRAGGRVQRELRS